MNDLETRRAQRTVEDLLGGIRVEPARPSYMDPADGHWHAYCLGFEAGVKAALKQIKARMNGA